MGSLSLINPIIYVHDLDLTGYLRMFGAKWTADEWDDTRFQPAGSATRSRIGGLKTVETSSDGFWESTPDASEFAALGVADRVITVSAEGAETKTAYMLMQLLSEYDPFGEVGKPAPFTLKGHNSSPQGLVRGQLAKAKGNVSATGQLGSILTMTGPTASQWLYATLHVFGAATTVTVQVQSATTLGFAGPTTRGTIGPITVAGGTWLVRVPGPLTDGFYRLNVSAITGTFSVGGAIGVA
jgi:hypothetical protein